MGKGNDKRTCPTCGARLASDHDSPVCATCTSARLGQAVVLEPVPPDFWNEPALQAALAARHMGRVIRAYRRHPHHGRRGLAQEDVAALAGKTQGQLSRIERGPAMQDLGRLVFWAHLLGIPEPYLWFKLPPAASASPAAPGQAVIPTGSRLAWQSDSRLTSAEEAADDPLLAERAAALGADLWEFHDVLQPMRVSRASLALAEDACARLDARYAELPPLVLLPELRRQTNHVLGWLRDPQPVAFRQRLCSLAGRLAGLRAWLFFDMADYQAAAAWFSTGMSAAHEADDLDLCGWLLGGQSLIPVEQGDYPVAAALLSEAQALVGRAASHTTRAWLDVLEARALAGTGDARGFAAAQQRAHKRLQRTGPAERRHGMDFADERLDLTYYEGLSHLLLGQPDDAGTTFQVALSNLPTSRIKARAVLLLSLGLATARAREFDEAAAQASEALGIAEEQPIRRVWQRAQEVRGALTPAADTEPVRDLDEHMRQFAGALERATT